MNNSGSLLLKCAKAVRLSLPGVALAALVLLMPVKALGQTKLEDLKQQLEEQQALNQAQQQLLEEQSRELDRLNNRLKQMEQSIGATSVSPQPQSVVAGPAPSPTGASGPIGVTARPTFEGMRDEIGDLNTQAVRAGEFPGSFRIPGPGNVSLAIGGFVKTVVIADSNAEVMGSDFLPALLGTRRADNDGAFSIDTTLTRLNLDARAPAGTGHLRGYVEADLNKLNDGTVDLKMRHAYGTWKTGYGTLTVGHTWSTMMDLKILPEGLTEPTVSGVIFMRQPIIRWSQPLDSQFTLHAALEDPSSNDVFSDQPTIGKTRVPDAILGLEYDRVGVGHLRLNSILRDVKVDLPGGGDDSEVGWGVALTGYLKLLEKDRLIFNGTYGQGLGRYFLGIQSIDGSAIDPRKNELNLRDNWGVMGAYEHHWTEKLRSTAMAGYAYSDPFSWQKGDTLENTTYVAVNLMWQVLPYMTVGVEYDYGVRENKDDSNLDNHRFMVGVQIY